MPNYVSSISVDAVIDALAAFLRPFVPGTNNIVRAQVNRVPMPADPCVVLTELLQVDIDQPYQDYVSPSPLPTDDGQAVITGPTRIDIQADFYGEASGEYCRVVQNAIRSQWAFDQFPAGVKPLYTSDGLQAPLTTGEQQYESRWTLTLSLQYNPTVSVPQQFAQELEADPVVAADVNYDFQ